MRKVIQKGDASRREAATGPPQPARVEFSTAILTFALAIWLNEGIDQPVVTAKPFPAPIRAPGPTEYLLGPGLAVAAKANGSVSSGAVGLHVQESGVGRSCRERWI